ncbi:conserved hypothetical protein [Methanohalobium evestigatum Z-7303]|uniref:Uncharacterized protein n=1 Tax=Methanohalobium evestigatum (strain ATCC BAA-1072 / DSM 3721 / NBRC 107634 / OCM 161 / Z-7303) TaxID=644295 RepID=D7E9Y6_METEZ|nr:M1 family aminopeptidase [Methanohalobium evestigatum]ADI74408.1 conserved hypothetical protein [Methanohalobium evestigatum Z-7303]
MKNIKKKIFFRCLFSFIVVAMFITPVSAGWNETNKEIESFYKLNPDEKIVNVFKKIHFTNYDSDTKYWQGYYSHLHHKIPENAINVDMWNSKNQKIKIQNSSHNDFYVSDLNQKIWYGQSCNLYLEYAIPINKNTADFKLYENADIINATVIVPDDYETYIDKSEYTVKHSSNIDMYKFKGIKNQLECSIDAVNLTDYKVLNKSVSLGNKNVGLKIKYWKGENHWANETMDLAIKALPILEEKWGFTYPKDHNITITQSTENKTSGYGGINKGEDGILLLHTADKYILIHELAHYWTQKCGFEYIWMDEGYADLYTYLVLNRLDSNDALERKEDFIKQYKSMKQSKNLKLSEWSVPDSIGSENFDRVDYGYKKSFVLLYNIYKKIGINSMKQANQRFLNSDNIGNKEFKHIIQTVSDKNLESEWKLLHSNV